MSHQVTFQHDLRFDPSFLYKNVTCIYHYCKSIIVIIIIVNQLFENEMNKNLPKCLGSF